MGKGDPKLTLEAQAAIRGYMVKLTALPSIILSILGFFVGFYIREGATAKAYQEACQRSMDLATEAYTKSYANTMTLAARVAQAAEQVPLQAQEIERVRKVVSDAEREFSSARQLLTSTEQVVSGFKDVATVVSNVSNSLSHDQAFQKAISDSVLTGERPWGVETGRPSFENGVHAWRNKDVTCPDGSFVTGVTVHFGGTCGNLCDPDGAPVRQITLVCRRL